MLEEKLEDLLYVNEHLTNLVGDQYPLRRLAPNEFSSIALRSRETGHRLVSRKLLITRDCRGKIVFKVYN